MVEGKGYTPVDQLEKGDLLVRPDGSTVGVLSVDATGETATVHNFEVEGLHTYYVQAGDSWLLVHNMCAAGKALEGLSDETTLVRGGTNTPERFTSGSGVSSDAQGNLSGVSVNSGKSVEEAAQGIKNGQIGVSAVGHVRTAGGTVIRAPTPNNPGHCLISDAPAEH